MASAGGADSIRLDDSDGMLFFRSLPEDSLLRNVLGEGNITAELERFKGYILDELRTKGIERPDSNDILQEGGIIIQGFIIGLFNRNIAIDDNTAERLRYFKGPDFLKHLNTRVTTRTDFSGKDKSYAHWFQTVFNSNFSEWRKRLTVVSDHTQCVRVLGEDVAPCYLCGEAFTEGMDPPRDGSHYPRECEHVLPVTSALSHLWLAKSRFNDYTTAEQEVLRLEYDWAHKCCNTIKSNIEFIILDYENKRYIVNFPACKEFYDVKLPENKAYPHFDCGNLRLDKVNKDTFDIRGEDNPRGKLNIRLNEITDIINKNIKKLGNIELYHLLMKFKIMSAFSNEGLIASLRGDPANPDESIPIYRPRGSSNASAGNAMATSTPAREPSPARSPSPGRGPRTEEQKEEMRRRRELRVQEAIRETEEEVRQLEEQREQQKRGRRMRINRLSQITARSVTQNQLTAGVSTSKGYFDMFYNLLPVSVKAGITRAMGIVVPAIQSVLPSTRYVAFGGSKRRSQKGGDRQAIFDEVERSEELTLPITFLRFIGIPEEAIEGFKQNGYIAIGPDNINVLNYYILRHIFANDIYKITREKFSELLSKLKAKSQKDMRRYEENTPAVIQYDFNIIDGTFDDTIRALRNNDRGVLKRITAQKSTRQAKTNLLKGSMLNITRRLNKLRARRSLQPTVKYGIPPTIIEEDEGQEITVGTPPRAYVPEVYRYGGRRSRKRQQKKKKTRRRN